MIVGPRVAESGCGVGQAEVDCTPSSGILAHHRDRPGIAVIRTVAEVEILLHPPQVRQHVGVRPPRAPSGCPAVVVVGHRPNGDHPVDRRRPAGAPTAQVRAHLLPSGPPRPESLPHEVSARVGVQRPPEVQAPQLARGVGRPPVGARLEHEHVASGVLAEPAGDDAAGRSGADDEPLRFHGHLPATRAAECTSGDDVEAQLPRGSARQKRSRSRRRRAACGLAASTVRNHAASWASVGGGGTTS